MPVDMRGMPAALGATLIAGTSVIGATGCGSGGTVDSSAVADAATATAGAGTAKIAVTGSVSRDGRRQALSGSGEIDLRTGGARMTVRSGPSTIEAILQRFVIYIHFPGAADEVKKEFHTDKPWIKIDVWVDAHHRVRREHWVQRQNSAQSDMTIETYDFGSPVNIAPPPASDTEDLTEKVEQQLQQQGG